MEIYRTNDNKVTKYVHDDGSETAIKHSIAEDCGGTYGKVTNKFNVFISSSVGCPIKCKFCYLTVKKFPYHHLTKHEITNNIIAAITEQVTEFPYLKDLYLKLSWMGMGEPLLNPYLTIDATDMIIRHCVENKLCKGIDGIDIGTTIPITVYNYTSLSDALKLFNVFCTDFPINPLRGNTKHVRLFYSLHSGLNDIRKSLIPHTMNIYDALLLLLDIHDSQCEVIIHHMLLENVNDNDTDIMAVIDLIKYYKYKLRILRFNTCANSPYIESRNVNNCIETLLKHIPDLKVQASPGSEVKAACGMFLMSQMKKGN